MQLLEKSETQVFVCKAWELQASHCFWSVSQSGFSFLSYRGLCLHTIFQVNVNPACSIQVWLVACLAQMRGRVMVTTNMHYSSPGNHSQPLAFVLSVHRVPGAPVLPLTSTDFMQSKVVVSRTSGTWLSWNIAPGSGMGSIWDVGFSHPTRLPVYLGSASTAKSSKSRVHYPHLAATDTTVSWAFHSGF